MVTRNGNPSWTGLHLQVERVGGVAKTIAWNRDPSAKDVVIENDHFYLQRW